MSLSFALSAAAQDTSEEKIGTTEICFDTHDERGNRIVGEQETNTGDLVADSLYYLFDNMGFDVDAAIVNGGDLYNKLITGDITRQTCKEILARGSFACLQTVTGQQLLDALEWGVRNAGNGESPGFLQVSGITYTVDISIPSTVKADHLGVWTGAPDKYRVYDVNIFNKESGYWEELDLTKSYSLAGFDHILRHMEYGFNMFEGSDCVIDAVAEDYTVLVNYIQSFENGKVESKGSPLIKKYKRFLINYGELNGAGRISYIKQEPPSANDPSDTESNESSNVPTIIVCSAIIAVVIVVAAIWLKKKKK